MSDVIIRAEGLGKKYIIGHQSSERYTALRDVLVQSAKNLARSAGDMLRGRPIYAGDELEDFWALKDINFDIRRGDVVGIIGRNGAGKSTLLKVLSRITEPTEGRIEISGRVASLLEVGTGFHPELTGRENIYLNGAILGMSRSEIKRKFDEIVDFAGVEKFLDTPVKRYSSGMYVRLAFSVAAHLEPEILIVDEVLAVGDAEFQKKCLGKMREVSGDGRTVLFVSHNMGSIKSLCGRGIFMQSGRIECDADTDLALARYSQSGSYTQRYVNESGFTDGASFQEIDIKTEDDRVLAAVRILSGTDFGAIINLRIKDAYGSPVGMASMGGYDSAALLALREGENRYVLALDTSTLANGTYTMDLDIEVPFGTYTDRISDRLSFRLEAPAGTQYGRRLMSDWGVGSVMFSAIRL